MASRLSDDDAPSLALVLTDALAFLLRNQAVFWLMALPIAGVGAGITYVLETDLQFIEWRGHWSWDFLFAAIYALFLDRWIKETLLDEASPCDEVDELRRSTISPCFLLFAAALCAIAIAVSLVAPFDLGLVPWAATAALFALVLPGLSAAEPISFPRAFALGRSLQGRLFALIGGAAGLSLLAGAGLRWVAVDLPDKPSTAAAVAAGQRLVDCVLLAFVGYALAVLYRQRTGWQPPEPDDHPFRGMRLRVRKA